MDRYCEHIQNEEAEEYVVYPSSTDVHIHLCKACTDELRNVIQEQFAELVNDRIKRIVIDGE